ncbi:MAG: DUF2155 domain-containing protein [Acetobacterales bacterium]
MRKLAYTLFALALTITAVRADGAAEVGTDTTGQPRAVLRGLDKVTARVTEIAAPLDGIAHFGTLEIRVRTCRKRPPWETPESAAFLEVWDARPEEPTSNLFRGWMFASSPALNALEHPVYDIWVIDCAGPGVVEGSAQQEASESTPSPQQAPIAQQTLPELPVGR